MTAKQDMVNRVLLAASKQGIASVLFRNAIGRKLRLNVADNECLSFISMHGTATPTEIARYTGLTSGSTTAMLDRLQNAGYIVRKPNPHDRRGVVIEAGSQWRDATMPLVAGVQAAHRELLATYSDEELALIEDFLTRFAQNVSEQTDKINQAA